MEVQAGTAAPNSEQNTNFPEYGNSSQKPNKLKQFYEVQISSCVPIITMNRSLTSIKGQPTDGKRPFTRKLNLWCIANILSRNGRTIPKLLFAVISKN